MASLTTMIEGFGIQLSEEDQRQRRLTRARLIDNSHEPAVRMFLDAETRMQAHRDRVMVQVVSVDHAMDIAEKEISNIVTTKWLHQQNSFDSRLTQQELHLGPVLKSIVTRV